MEKKTLVTATLSVLIFLAATQLCFVEFTNANRYEHIPAAPLAYPSITILSPAENNTLHNLNNLTITFKANIKSGSAVVWTEGIDPHKDLVNFEAHIDDVYYKPSWQPNNIKVSFFNYSDPLNISYIINLNEIPEGNQTVTITAYGSGNYINTRYIVPEYPWGPSTESVCCDFDSVSYCAIGFTVDTVPPNVSVLELDNKTFAEPEVPLSFTVNETASKITYCLDGQGNVTITRNTTLTGLSDGEHSLTVYAMDEAGNVGVSESVYFSVVSFPTSLVVASVITIAVVCGGLLVYLKKRKH